MRLSLVGLPAVTTAAMALAGALMVLTPVLGYRAWKLRRVNPAERERQRRAALVASGKISDATLIEIRELLLFYSYQVRGVEYIASQDVSELQPYMPADLAVLSAISVKYDPRNPADSILLSEQWSGLRASKYV